MRWLFLFAILIVSCSPERNPHSKWDSYYPNWRSSTYLGMSLPGWWRPFSDSSPWNTPIPDNPQILPNSSAIVANIKQYSGQATLKPQYKEWCPPLHIVNSDNIQGEPVYCHNALAYHESVDKDQNGVSDSPVPFTSDMWWEPSNDAHMIIVDPFKGIAWEFSIIRYNTQTSKWESSTHAVWDLNGEGQGVPFSGKTWWKQGCRGSGVPLIGGLVRPEEIEAGEIRHALCAGCPCNAKNLDQSGKRQLVRPACRTDGWLEGADFPLEGARLQLDPNLDLDSLGLCEEAKIVARALQKYGLFIVDNAGGFSIYFQCLDKDGSGSTWRQRFPSLMDDIKKIPLDAFRVLKYGSIYEK